MTPEQFRNVDPACHTAEDLVAAINTSLVLGTESKGRTNMEIASWLLTCARNDEDSAYKLARQIVIRLRSDDGGPAIHAVSDAIEMSTEPEFA